MPTILRKWAEIFLYYRFVCAFRLRYKICLKIGIMVYQYQRMLQNPCNCLSLVLLLIRHFTSAMRCSTINLLWLIRTNKRVSIHSSVWAIHFFFHFGCFVCVFISFIARWSHEKFARFNWWYYVTFCVFSVDEESHRNDMYSTFYFDNSRYVSSKLQVCLSERSLEPLLLLLHLVTPMTRLMNFGTWSYQV